MKAFGRRDRRTYERVMTAIGALIYDPRPPGARKLSGQWPMDVVHVCTGKMTDYPVSTHVK